MCGELDVVNVVGSGKFDLEFDLTVLALDLGGGAEYDPDRHTGMHIRLSDGALITLYRTGSYHIVGVESGEELMDAREKFITRLQDLDIDFTPGENDFGVRNIVCTGDYGRAVNLNKLAIGLGLENVEYEPEQFPGLVYRPSDMDAVVLVFATGKLVVTGIVDLDTADNVFSSVCEDIEELSE